MSNSKIWYVVIDGRADGPHSEDQLKEWLHSTKISYSDLVFRPGLARWVSAAECKEFERRADEPKASEAGAAAEVKLEVPQESEEGDGWVALIKHAKVDGSNHYIQSGPYTTSQIQQRLNLGQMKYEDHVWQKGYKSWTPISQVKEFERRRDPETPPPMPNPATQEAAAASVKARAVPQAEEKMAEIKMTPSTATPATTMPASKDSAAASTQPATIANHVKVKPAAYAAAATSTTGVSKEHALHGKGIESEKNKTAKVAESSHGAEATEMTESTKPAISAETSEIIEAAEEPAQVSTESDVDDDSVEAPIMAKKSRRLLIASAGAALAMALVYAGINSYREMGGARSERRVASEEAPIPPPPPLVEEKVAVPTAPAPAPVAMRAPPAPLAQVKNSVAAVPVDPEIQNPKPKQPTTLKVMTLKGTDRPQLALETDLPPGTVIEVRVAARAGSILRYPSFLLNKKINVLAGQMPSIDLSTDKLPSGTYRVSVESGSLKDAINLAVGVHDTQFNKKLLAFKKLVQKQAKAERATLNTDVRSLAGHYQTLVSTYQKTKGSGSVESRKKWNQMLRNWRKDYDKEIKSLKSVTENTRNRFVYPEQWLRLKSMNVKMKELAMTYDQSLKSGRAVASDGDPGAEFKGALKELRAEVNRLK